ncbi:hypothetical protein [Lunatimonas salinarum]|uniref:hypothetical protein n=1 Tax=Lunatimonas salinarum TaxID=1774590 RepID=UPI001AE01E65|nr:hypothetical protein [Lunatimonas salinarum]
MKILGTMLMVIGVIMFVITGVSYTIEETIVDAGPIELKADREREINWPPYAGGVAVVAGLALVGISRKR